MKTDEEKQVTKDARNERRRDAAAAAKVKAEAEELMTDVATLSPGDTFTLDEVGYVVQSLDGQSGHIHTSLLEGQENPDTHGSVAFGTMVDVIAKAKPKRDREDKAAVTPAQVPMNPAVTGGTWFK